MATNEQIAQVIRHFDSADGEFAKYNEASLGQTAALLLSVEPYSQKAVDAFRRMAERYFVWAKQRGITSLDNGRTSLDAYEQKLLAALPLAKE